MKKEKHFKGNILSKMVISYVYQNLEKVILLIKVLVLLHNERKSTIRVQIKPYHGSCVYLTRVDNLVCCGLIACRIIITNKSNSACGINNIILKLNGQMYEAVPYQETVISDHNDIKFIDKLYDTPKYMKVSSENVFNDLQLKPYETRTVYVTFSTSCFDIDKIIYSGKKAKLELTIANKKFVSKFYIKMISDRYEQVL